MGVKLAFRHQRAIFGFVVLGLIILFSTAVLWGHYEKIITNYQWLAKAGLALVDVIAIGLAIWHFYAKHTPLKVWCYLAEGAIAAMMIIHAGAVLQLDSSTAQQKDAVQTAADVQVKLIKAQGEADAGTEAARIKAAGEAAASVRQQTGSTTLASRTLQTGKTEKSGAPAQSAETSALVKQASEIKPTTFLSDGYMHGGLYYYPALFAFALFFIAIGVSAFSEKFEDVNRNGIPDSLERAFGRDVQPAGDGNNTLYGLTPEGKLVEVQHSLSEEEARRRAMVDAVREQAESRLTDEQRAAGYERLRAAEEGLQAKPTVTWRGGKIVKDEKEDRGN